jgi:membrane-bound ClpP family serine protease
MLVLTSGTKTYFRCQRALTWDGGGLWQNQVIFCYILDMLSSARTCISAALLLIVSTILLVIDDHQHPGNTHGVIGYIGIGFLIIFALIAANGFFSADEAMKQARRDSR